MSRANGTSKVVSPSKLAHVVLHTNKYDRMRSFYKSFLGASAAYEDEKLCFLTYDKEHHRIALINMPHLQDKDPRMAGLGHIAFTFDSLKDLCSAYKARKEIGIEPGWCVNHGPTVSMYYQDPDGNSLETQVDSFDSPEEATASMSGPAFVENPIGSDFDPEELCKAVESGMDEAELKVRKDVGARGSPEDMKGILAQMAKSKTGA